jgi:hypothetical protein
VNDDLRSDVFDIDVFVLVAAYIISRFDLAALDVNAALVLLVVLHGPFFASA